jgi:outer membrane protein OmpA-like peptidoglycan-associated protein
MNIKYLSIAFFCLISVFIQAQSKKAFLQEAEKAFGEKNYHGALVYFDEALQFDKNDGEILYKTAEAARMYNAYGFAASKYAYLIDTLRDNSHPDAIFRLGEVYHKLGEYTKAMKSYNLYLSEYSNTDANMTALARKNLAAVTKATSLINKRDENVTITKLGDDVNSPDADFAASDMNGKMYFSSLKFSPKSKELRYKQISKTLVKNDNNVMSSVVPGYINDRDKSIAHFAFNTQGNKVYYSICEYANGWSQSCQIFSSDVDKDGNLSNEIALPATINAENSSNTQPSIGKNKDGKEVLYFVSDRVGGQGGRDIYSVVIDGSNIGAVNNVKIINTKDDEISPFYHSATNTMYWSSEGREGFGGFDLFKMKDGSNNAELLPAPYNSSMNDMFYYMNESGSKGYLTSNRSGSAYQYDSYEACCMDIYSIDVKQDVRLDVITLLQTDMSDLNGTRICLIDADTNQELECIDNAQNLNKHSFNIKPNRNYKLVATKNGFTTATDVFKAKPNDSVITRKLILAPADIKLEVFTFENPSKMPLSGTTVTLTDLTDGSVQKVVLTNNTKNDFYFDVKPGRSYRLDAVKDGYVSASETLNTTGLVGTIRKDMYLQKATLQDLLPISLYFDNDYPNPRSNQSTTSTKFVALANDYIMRKDDYIKNFTAPMSGTAKQDATVEIESFFRDDVAMGKDKFVSFLRQLEQRLTMGQKIELEVRGFASPRSKSDYNKILSERRINSIKNEMKTFDGGIISKYIDNGALKLKDVSFGDKTAKANVISDLKDERNSIYNIDAARERRVEIIKVNYN